MVMGPGANITDHITKAPPRADRSIPAQPGTLLPLWDREHAAKRQCESVGAVVGCRCRDSGTALGVGLRPTPSERSEPWFPEVMRKGWERSTARSLRRSRWPPPPARKGGSGSPAMAPAAAPEKKHGRSRWRHRALLWAGASMTEKAWQGPRPVTIDGGDAESPQGQNQRRVQVSREQFRGKSRRLRSGQGKAAKPTGGVGAPVCEGRACEHRTVWRHHPARSRSARNSSGKVQAVPVRPG